MAAKKKVGRPASRAKQGKSAARRTIGFRDFVVAARKLPGVEESKSYGTPALKVAGKLILRMHDRLDAAVLIVDFVSRQILMQADPETFFITDHYRNYPAVLVRLSAVRRDALPDLVERAWREVAPSKLLVRYDSDNARIR